MIAVTIMALVLASSVVTMQRGFLQLDAARSETMAGQIMQLELEQIHLRDWSVVSAYPTEPTEIPIDTAFLHTAGIGNRFRLTRTVSSPFADMLEITLTATWTTIDGRPQSRVYTIYYGHHGLHDFFYNTT